MSRLNGDKARFQRLRKAGLLRRQRARKVWAAMRREATGIHPATDSEQPARRAESPSAAGGG